MNSNFVIEKLITAILGANMNQVEIAVYSAFTFYDTGMVCLGMGWDAPKIAIDLQFTLQFYDCYKTMLDNLGDWKANWISDTAKWITECKVSNS